MASGIGAPSRPFRFFLSYSWDNRGRPLERFFNDLAQAVRKLVGESLEKTAFRDRVTMEAGTEWTAELLDALTTSQVLVYLISEDYLRSDYCGKELRVFLERVEQFRRGHPGIAPRFIQPVIWLPTPIRTSLPAQLGIIQTDDDGYPKQYAARGLESLAKRSDKKAYNSFVDTLAMRIVDAGKGPPLPPLTRYASLDEIPNAFLAEEPVGRRPDPAPVTPVTESEMGVRCVYIAPKQSEVQELLVRMAKGKERPLRTSTEFFSPSGGWHWQPFNPPVPVKIGSLVQQLVTDLPYNEIFLEDEEQPEGAFELAVQRLRAAAKRDQIILLIVDAWAAYVSRYQQLLKQLDEVAPTGRTAILVPWNDADADTAELGDELQMQLRVLFRTKYLGGQPSPFFKPRVPTIDDFRQMVPAVLKGIREDIETLRAAEKIVESTRSTPQVRSSRGLEE